MFNIHIISLGCPKNTVDTERLLASLGIKIQSVSNVSEADIIFINTCSFITSAVEESVETILEAINDISLMERKPYIIVAGCLVGRYGEEVLKQDIPEVDLWLSNQTISTWGLSILSLLNLAVEEKRKEKRMISTRAYSWLKIAEGCSHSCSFCTIPSIRGKYSSYSKSSILLEAQELVSKGIKELVVVAQDITTWGQDSSPKDSLANLLQEVGAIPDLQWLRLLYLYPAGVTQELLDKLVTIPTFIPYFDIPMQHVHPDIVATMGRPFAHNPWKIIERVRNVFPHAALRTSIIVGFPGETEEHFSYLLSFVKEAGFAHLGVFMYQQEEGTPAATFSNQVPESVKEERKQRLLEVQAEQSQKYLSSFVGSTQDIIIDSKSDEWEELYQGRAWFQAPEFDGVTYISGDFTSLSPIGTVERAIITENSLYDLVAVV